MDSPRCAHCRDVVGVYEPVRVVLSDGTERHGSPLTLGDQLGISGSVIVHEHCYEAFEGGRTDAGA
jgi:hypothetical protein